MKPMILSRIFSPARPLSPWLDDRPMQSELFGTERLEDHARSLAGAQQVANGNSKGAGLSVRLAENSDFLLKATQALTLGESAHQELTPAAEWLIDNYHLVAAQIREIRIDLPPGYYEQLPKLSTGPFISLPRVFGAMWSLVAHTDGLIEPEALRGYLHAYQQVQPLTIGELWAVPITLRIVLIENLRRVAAIVVANRAARAQADALASRILGLDGLATMQWVANASLWPASSPEAFAVQLAHRLRGRDPKGEPALTWLDEQLTHCGLRIEDVVRDELQQQGTFNATIRNIITSLRMATVLDWTETFEKLSLVDVALSESGRFSEMDFASRNLYRCAIEQLARHSPLNEIEIASHAVALAADAAAIHPSDVRRSDTGFYLLSGGRRSLENKIGFRPSILIRARRVVSKLGLFGYGGSIVIVAALFLAAPICAVSFLTIDLRSYLFLLGCVGILPASDAAVAIVNRLSMWAAGARPLPGLELPYGIPSECRTIVAIPTMLSSVSAVQELIRHLEVHHLASPDGELHFALVTDWVDSPTEQSEGDETLLAAALHGVEGLNRRYTPTVAGDRFLLLHRRRLWNAGEGSWMGWERKRGKLHELNRLLRGATDTTFLSGFKVPVGVRYVLTLDSDTRLPRDAARRLIGKMAHPLNRPKIDVASGRVIEGHAVLQPRVTPLLPREHNASLFQRIFSSMDGIDPYAGAVSDVYQDLFGEGSFAGKGIYDVDAFETALAGRVPESTMLSHDLFEGIFARAGLASDIEVVEEFPTSYAVSAVRQHRWARGDWQLLPWIMLWRPRLRARSLGLHRLPAIGRWKMLDNLRRSLSAPAFVLALAAGWLLPFVPSIVWTVFVLASVTMPPLIPVVGDLARHRRGGTMRRCLGDLGVGLAHTSVLVTLIVTFMAHQSILMGDAVVRTLTRLVAHRRLLQWLTAAEAGAQPDLTLWAYYGRMIGAPALGVVATGLALVARPRVWILVGPFAALWILSPAVAWWASRRSAKRHGPAEADAQALRVTARRTWRFFETFVTPADNMLPPDNFQEEPFPVLARRTSPTNIGLFLLCTVNAHDFGWVGIVDTVSQLEETMETLAKMAKFRGHLYNWYATEDLQPLEPKYVSTVDSGNLAGHLIALATACRQWSSLTENSQNAAEDLGNILRGLADTISVALEMLAHSNGTGACPEQNEPKTIQTKLQALGAQVLRLQSIPKLTRPHLAKLRPFILDAVTLARALDAGDVVGRYADLLYWTDAIGRVAESHERDLGGQDGSIAARLASLEMAARDLALAMDFAFLRNRERKLLSIGYLVAEGTLDANCYDLLASEARLACFVAIAKGDVPAKDWFRLGRSMALVGESAALISWSGSMFEYLMPSLVMRAPTGSLIDGTNRLAVRRQIEFGRQRALPWGASESAYNVRDREYTYQYSNFGVPDLGLKRGLEAERVVAPYATLLAAMIDPRAAVANLGHLASDGARGQYGFYEAMDYTLGRVPAGKTVAVVQAYMAHHQGMSIVAIADTTLNGVMRSRFHAEPLIEATELLLQERAPRSVSIDREVTPVHNSAVRTRMIGPTGGRRFDDTDGASPNTHLLCNGSYAVMLTASGSGYSRWNDVAITRWREDPTLDDWGSYIYLRDVNSSLVWSAGMQPCGVAADDYSVTFNEDRAEFTRRDGTLVTFMEVLVAAEEAAEVRRIAVTNNGNEARTIDITSYAELSLSLQATDVAHPAFNKLFIETEYLTNVGALLATRRRRSLTEPEIWAAHLAVADGIPEVETDRARFIGRGRDLRRPAALSDDRALSGTVGTVLDPIFSIRRRITVEPGMTMRVAFWTLAAGSREGMMACIDRHRDVNAFDRAAMMAWTWSQVQLHHLGISAAEADLFQRLGRHLIFAGSALRPASDKIRAGSGAQAGLWSQGISGDLPILLLRINEVSDLAIGREVLLAYMYFRLKQFAVDLVILNEHGASYAQELQVALEALLRAQQIHSADGQSRVYLLRADLIPRETSALLAATARVVLAGDRGRISEQLDRAERSSEHARPVIALSPKLFRNDQTNGMPPLDFFNGIGGFTKDGAEYVVALGPNQTTPAPWINVIANPGFGFLVSAEGSGFTWAGNSREGQLTPWSNDPVSDRGGEAFYLYDEASGALWCPTAAPARDPTATYIAHHGHGYSVFDHVNYGIESRLLQFVAPDDPVKISRLRLRNTSTNARSISVCAYVEWVIGPSRSATMAFVETELDSETCALFARNPWNTEQVGQVAFMDLGGTQTSWTGDRREFLGRNGSLAMPCGPTGALSGTLGAGYDPCGAMRTVVELPPGAEAELILVLGAAADAMRARSLVAFYRDVDIDRVLDASRAYWKAALGAIEVKTPDQSMDIMLNGWLLYQTLASRVLARAGFYQASGAYGFRDQLQDGMALCAARPDLVREHLLRAAGRQFLEGDVQHWWLPKSGRGVRTRISDDCAWLAYTVAHYVNATGDVAVLDEPVGFLSGPALHPDEHDRFFLPSDSEMKGPLYEHCARALDHSLLAGHHGLPLIGTGDWNDGMNRLGEGGRGESVWLGWFLHTALTAFLPLAEARGDSGRASVWRTRLSTLAEALEQAWDGDWYLRAYNDEGTPVGSHSDSQCMIDSIAQSWSVISRVAPAHHAARAMASVARYLLRAEDELLLVLTPPFNAPTVDPGYIAGYPPGIRENGGQYSHAAIWAVLAFVGLGDGDKAGALFAMLNPISHARTKDNAERYKLEPYAVAADIYSTVPHIGRGGWSWYTGSAGWMQRVGVESILGLRVQSAFLYIDPCIPRDWPGFTATIRWKSSRYAVTVKNPSGVTKGVQSLKLDGMLIDADIAVTLIDDAMFHQVEVVLGKTRKKSSL